MLSQAVPRKPALHGSDEFVSVISVQKNQTKPLKTLRLRKEALRVLSSEQLTEVQGGTAGGCCAYGGTAINSASNDNQIP